MLGDQLSLVWSIQQAAAVLAATRCITRAPHSRTYVHVHVVYWIAYYTGTQLYLLIPGTLHVQTFLLLYVLVPCVIS